MMNQQQKQQGQGQQQQLVAHPAIHVASYDRYEPGQRFDTIYLYNEYDISSNNNNNKVSSSTTTTVATTKSSATTGSKNEEPNNFRYKITIIDSDLGRPEQFTTTITKNSTTTTTTTNNNNNKSKKITSTKTKKKATTTPVVNTTTVVNVTYATIVLIIPFGRDREYMFTTRRGLESIAQSAKTCRLIAVSVGRSLLYNTNNNTSSSSSSSTTTSTSSSSSIITLTQEQIQKELETVVQVLGRQGSFIINNKYYSQRIQIQNSPTVTIPFVTLGTSLGSCTIIATGSSPLSGPYTIEQVGSDNDDTNDNRIVLQRLYFDNNPFVIQSEVALVSSSSSSDSSNSVSKSQIDPSYIAFGYHKTIAAGVVALLSVVQNNVQSTTTTTTTRTEQLNTTSTTNGLLIGLGAGGLVHYLQYLFGWINQTTTDQYRQHHLLAIELDPEVITIAQKYFGIIVVTTDNDNNNNNNSSNKDPHNTFRIICGNGLAIEPIPAAATERTSTTTVSSPTTTDASTTDDVEQAGTISESSRSEPAPISNPSTTNTTTATTTNTSKSIPLIERSYRYIILDVDSKDTTIGMSCPPIEFVSAPYLQVLKQLLVPSGFVAINVSARDPVLLRQVYWMVRTVFPIVYITDKNNVKKKNKTKTRTNGKDNEDKDNDDDDNDEDNNSTSQDDNNNEDDDLNVVMFAMNRSDQPVPVTNQTNDVTTVTIQDFDKAIPKPTSDCVEDLPNVSEEELLFSSFIDNTEPIEKRNRIKSSVLQSIHDDTIIADLVDCLETLTIWTDKDHDGNDNSVTKTPSKMSNNNNKSKQRNNTAKRRGKKKR